jgi:hypothetical protein
MNDAAPITESALTEWQTSALELAGSVADLSWAIVKMVAARRSSSTRH